MGTAWDEIDTRRSYRRSRWIGRALLTTGIALFIGFTAYVTPLYDHADELVAHGIQTPGVVLDDPAYRPRCGQVEIHVAFDTAERREVHPFWVDSCGSGLRKGDHVRVSYDAHDSNDFAVNGEPSEHPLPTLFACIALVLSTLFVIMWLLLALRLHRTRRVLQHAPWSQRSMRVTPFARTSKGSRFILDSPDALSPSLVTPRVVSRWGLPVQQQFSIAGPWRDRYVVRKTGSRSFLFAREPRDGKERDRVERALAAVRAIAAPAG